MIEYTIEWIWHVVLGMTVVFYLAAYVAPRAMMGLQSMPWAFHVEKNLDLDLQSVLYATYHTRGFSRFTHLTIPIEQVAWFVVLAFVHPAAINVAIVLLGAQAFLCKELQLAMLVMMAWAAVAGAALLGIYLLGLEGAYGHAVVLLLGCGLFRVVGHVVEPLPPMIVERSDRFVPISRLREVTPKLPLTLLLGFVSEFASGLPFRLFIVQVSWLAQALGYRPRRVMPWARARKIAAEIHISGWRAYTPVTELMAPHFVLDLPVPQAVPQPALARSGRRR
jgi:hypothetical protein